MTIIKAIGFQCVRCSWKWTAKTFQNDVVLPKVCPHCHSRRWNGPKNKYYDYLSFVQEKDRLPVEIFIRSHFKAGDDHDAIFDCVMQLPEDSRNPKAWLEGLWRKKQK